MSSFEIRPEGFFLDGQPFQIRSGSMHYFRVVPQYWRDRLIRLKNMGLNCVETYIAWNVHERRRGIYDFTGMADVEAYVRLAGELGLYVILRPSPYICAEWEFGGLPAWLLKEEMVLRSSDPVYLGAVEKWYQELIPRLVPLQVTHGGPVILMQVENEYGSYGNDRRYLQTLRDWMRSLGVDVPLITSDGPEEDMLECGTVEGVHVTCNFGSRAEERLDYMESRGISPLMCMEFWCGWFDAWQNPDHARTDPVSSAEDLKAILRRGHVNLYMFHGGTSFGLASGANDYDCLTPDVTSYDYDAPLSEDGRETEKYRLYREAIEEHLGHPVPRIPLDPVPMYRGGQARLTESLDLLSCVDGVLHAHGALHPQYMEEMDVDRGYMLYRTLLTEEKELKSLRFPGSADRLLVYLNGKLILTAMDRELQKEFTFDPPLHCENGEMEILAENMGRVNYSWVMNRQRKGVCMVVINRHVHMRFDMIPLGEEHLLRLRAMKGQALPGRPGLYRMVFDCLEPGDAFLELPGAGKGVVFVNGFCLGRFWDKGPQRRLYMPGPLMHRGENELWILETEGRMGSALLCNEPDLGPGGQS